MITLPPGETPGKVAVWSAAEVGAGDVAPELARVLAWARSYLVSPNPNLGRKGPVCPYTQPALQRGLFYLATTGADVQDAVDCLRTWYEAVSSAMSAADRELLTVLLVLPDVDPVDPTQLDDLQGVAKNDFVENGLMIGQFHPACEAPGLWNPHFRPLRAPIPLLAIRTLVVFDLPFLMEKRNHLESWLRRFAPDIPPRVRSQLAARVIALNVEQRGAVAPAAGAAVPAAGAAVPAAGAVVPAAGAVVPAAGDAGAPLQRVPEA